jgi:hypothetical protein
LNSDLTLKEPFSERYPAGGLKTLVDGIRGTNNFRDGMWQGYEGVDFCAVIDLKMQKEISKISIGCLQDATSWIFFPTEVEFQISIDNINFIKVGTLNNNFPQNTPEAILKDFTINFSKNNIRYLMVKAKNVGKCPTWHPGAGGKAWLFIDEIIVE